MTKINSKLEIISALKESSDRAKDWFANIPVQEFFIRQGEVWSASDNVDHLIKAVKPIAKALKLPRVALQTMFGRPNTSSRTYDELCRIYHEAIAKGAQASGSFLPYQDSPDDPGAKKIELLAQFSRNMDRLISVVESWEEDSLDEAQLPHPLIGKLTIREMLFFTIYHNLRHASQAGD